MTVPNGAGAAEVYRQTMMKELDDNVGGGDRTMDTGGTMALQTDER